jgi:hypothetical protein
MLIIWAYGFFHPAIPLTEYAAPLYKLLLNGIIKHPFLSTLISFILILCEAMLLNYIVEKNEITDTVTYLPALVYVVLMSLQPEMFSLHPIVIGNLFMLLALHKLMQTYRKEIAYSETFDTGLFISLAALFYIPSIVFILLLWIGLIIIRPFIWREWLISFIGLILPWLYLVFYYFWNDKLDMLEYEVIYYTFITSQKSFNLFMFSYPEYFQIAILLVAVFFSVRKLIDDIGKSTVQTRNNLTLLLYFFFIGFVSIFLAPSYSIACLSFLAIPVSALFSNYLLFTKKEYLAEILLMLLLISVFINQFV